MQTNQINLNQVITEILISLEAQRESFELYCSESVMNDVNGLFELIAGLYE